MKKIKKVLHKIGGWVVILGFAIVGLFINHDLKANLKNKKEETKDDLDKTKEEIKEVEKDIEQSKDNLNETKTKTNQIIEEGVESNEKIDSDDADRIIDDVLNS
jgi:peptidoglycan hydrolase CwlO-like protein